MPEIDDNTPPEKRLAVLTMAEALGGSRVTWPGEFTEGWGILVHFAGDIPGAVVRIELPTGGAITRTRPDPEEAS